MAILLESAASPAFAAHARLAPIPARALHTAFNLMLANFPRPAPESGCEPQADAFRP